MRPTTPPSPRRRTWPVALAMAVTLLAAVAAPTALAMDPAPPELDGRSASSRLAQAEAQVLELKAMLDEASATNAALSLENVELETENTTLERANEALALERDRLAASVAHLGDLFDPLEADRQLLVTLRKDLPTDSRAEAEAHIERLRRLSLASNPSALGRLADRVAESAPAYLDWRFTEHSSPDAATQAYISSGANAFDSTMTALRSAILLSVANRLDGLLNVLDRIR